MGQRCAGVLFFFSILSLQRCAGSHGLDWQPCRIPAYGLGSAGNYPHRRSQKKASNPGQDRWGGTALEDAIQNNHSAAALCWVKVRRLKLFTSFLSIPSDGEFHRSSRLLFAAVVVMQLQRQG